MKLGMFLRAENTGLSRMSLDAYTNLHPDAALIIDVDHPQPMHTERFLDTPIANPKDTGRFENAVKDLLRQIDTLLILETPYNPNVYEWARRAGVYTVCVAMPEYHIPWRWGADLVINPTTYLHERLPTNSIIFPWPVDLNTIPYRPRSHIDSWLHIVGQPCSQDRNGTQLVMDAFAKLPDQNLTVRSQVPLPVRRQPNITYLMGNVDTPGELYACSDAIIMPRRYAGQSLPMNEAQASGLPLIVLDREPERAWTSSSIPAHVSKEWKVARKSRFDIGPKDYSTSGLDVYDAHLPDVIATINRIASDDAIVAELSTQSRRRAESISWTNLGDRWRDLLSPVRVKL